MKGLKATLFAIYAGLILLLIFMNLKGCNHPSEVKTRDTVRIADTIESPTDDTASADTAVERRMEGERGALRVAMLWDYIGDVDVHVVQPNGRCIDYTRRSDPSTSAMKDVDNTAGGERSAENIYWDTPSEGVYSVYIHYFATKYPVMFGPVKVIVQTSLGETTRQQKVFDSNLSRRNEWEPICRFEYKNDSIRFLDTASTHPSATECRVFKAKGAS